MVHNPTSSEPNARLFAEKIICNFNLNSQLDKNSLAVIRKELIEMFHRCSKYLDTKYMDEVLSSDNRKITSSLWEMIILNYLFKRKDKHPEIIIDAHEDVGPDWKITVKNKEYYIEATCAHLPDNAKNSEIHRVIDEFSNIGKSTCDTRLGEEAKSRISNVISEKINKHSSFMSNKNAGYILCVSYGGLPFYASCDLYRAVETILTIGPLQVDVKKESMSMQDEHLSYQNCFKKITSESGALIPTNIFDNDDNSWISAILFSKIEPCLLLENSALIPGINWRDKQNDFVLVHNPKANYPLEEDIFGCSTIIQNTEGKLIITGSYIYPTFRNKA